MADSSEFVKLAPKIASALKKPGQEAKLQAFIKKEIGMNSEVYAKPILSKPLPFTVAHQTEFFSLFGLDADMIVAAIQATTQRDVKAGMTMYKAPMYLGCTMLVRHFLLTKNMKMANLVSVFFNAWLYELMYNKYFMYDSKEEVMSYTVNGLSEKFLLRKLGSLFKLIIYCADAGIKKNGAKLIKTKDDDIWLFPATARNKLNLSIQNIATVYYDNLEQGNFLNKSESTATDEEGNEYQRDVDTASGNIAKAATKFEMFFLRNNIDPVLCKLASSMVIDISDHTIHGIMEKIKMNNSEAAKDFITCCVDFFSRELKDYELRFIKSKGFGILVAKTLVKKTNKDIVFKKLFESIEKMARFSSETYRTTSRVATKLNIERAIAIYLALTLQKAY